MSRQLEMLEADLREVQAHLAVWPGDPYAHGRLASIQAAIEAATPPAMSHQRQRADLGKPAQAAVHKAKDVTDEWNFGRTNMFRFTFGENPDMDERWLTAERAKAKGVRGDQRTVPQPHTTAEPDKYGFPIMAYDLTGFRNLNYGTRNY